MVNAELGITCREKKIHTEEPYNGSSIHQSVHTSEVLSIHGRMVHTSELRCSNMHSDVWLRFTLTIIKSKISVRVCLKIKMENLVLIFATSIWETANPSSYSKLLVLCPLLMINFCKSNYYQF